MSWICPSCNKSTCVGCEPTDDVLPMTHEVLCACTDSCAKDAEIERLRAELVRYRGAIDTIYTAASACRGDEQSTREDEK